MSAADVERWRDAGIVARAKRKVYRRFTLVYFLLGCGIGLAGITKLNRFFDDRFPAICTAMFLLFIAMAVILEIAAKGEEVNTKCAWEREHAAWLALSDEERAALAAERGGEG